MRVSRERVKTAPPSGDPAVGPEEIRLFDRGLLIDVDVCWWTGRLRLDAEDVGMARDEVPELFRLGSKYMVEPRRLAPFRGIASQVKRYLAAWALPFPLSGTRFVPIDLIERVSSFLSGRKEEYDHMADRFRDGYPQMVEAVSRNFPDVWEGMRDLYPSAKQVRARFVFRYRLFAIRFGDGAGLFSEQEAMRQRRAAREAADEFGRMYATVLRAQIDEMARGLAEKLERGGPIRKASVDRILKLCDRFDGGLNFLGDPGVSAAVSELRRISASAQVRDARQPSEVTRDLAAELRKVSEGVSNMVEVDQAGMTLGRRIRAW